LALESDHTLPPHVMNFLGHKSIKNTLIYIQLKEAIFKEEDD
jgi:hypothetical protein